MKNSSPIIKPLPLDIVGSTAFGRYPKISIEQTFNMLISDNWLVPFAGYQLAVNISGAGEGRGLFSSVKFKHMVLVVDNGVYICDKNLGLAKVGELDTFSGDVFIDENDADQIAICDKEHIYVFNYKSNTFAKASIDFRPGYIAFQDGYFISPDLNQAQWRLSDPNNGLSWPAMPQNVGSFQTKPDIPVAAIRFPGKGNMLIVMGSTVSEMWYDLGYQLFPYQKNTYQNIDFGCLNPATIAALDNIVVWLGANEKSGPAIMVSQGGDAQQISNDGINFRLSHLNNPKNAYGFLYKQDGHLIYQITFPDDNLTLIFDFETKKFFTLCDENMNYHVAKKVVYFEESYYFISFQDGNLYELNSEYTTFAGKEIPRIRVCKNIRLPDQSRFVVNNLSFTLEQGNSKQEQAIDFSFSIDGGESFSSSERQVLNSLGHRPNKLIFWNKGAANDFVPQFRFWGFDRFVASNGIVSIYQ